MNSNNIRISDIDINDKLIRMQLVSIRKSRGISQKDIADFTGLSISTISNIETGAKSTTMDSLIKYTISIGASISIIPLKGKEK
jgi:transcriptional regulator with XRE-family HTH domain